MKHFLLILAVMLCLGFSSGAALAQTPTSPVCQANGTCTYVPLEPLPGLPQDGNADFGSFLAGIFRLVFSLGALFAVTMFVIAGVGYMLSESAVDISKAKDRGKAALWGMLLLAMSWLILNTINPKLLNFQIFGQEVTRVSGQPPGATRGAGTITVQPTTQETQQKINICQTQGKRLVSKSLDGNTYYACE